MARRRRPFPHAHRIWTSFAVSLALLAGFIASPVGASVAQATPLTTTITLKSGDPVNDGVLPSYKVEGTDEFGSTAVMSPCGGGGATVPTSGRYGTIDGTDWVTPWDGSAETPLPCPPSPAIGDSVVTDYAVPFSLPSAYQDPSIDVQMFADNIGVVSLNVNANVIGSQTGGDLPANYGGTPSTFTSSNPSFFNAGDNTLLFRVTDLGFATGLDFAVTITYTPVTVPDAPVLNQVFPGRAQVSFDFSPGASDGGAAVSGFKVSVCPPTGPCGVISLGATTFSGIASGLTNGTQYCLTVVATNAVGDSPPSAVKCATPDASSDTQLISGTAPITLSNVPPGGQPAAGTIASTVNLFADPNNAGKPAGLTVKPVIPNSGFQCLAPGGVTSTCMTNKFVEATYPTGNMNRLHKETNAFSRTDSIDKDGIPCFAAQLDKTGKPMRCLLPLMPLCPPTGGGLRCAFIYYVTMQIPGFSLVDSSGQLRPRPVSCSSAGCDASAVIGSSLIGGIPMPGQPGKYIVRPWCLSSSGNCAFAPAISMVEFTFQFSHSPIITGVKFSEWVPGDPKTGVLR